LDNPGLEEFLSSHTSFRHLPADSTGRPLAPASVFQLDYLGAGGETLLVHPASSTSLAELLQASGESAGIVLETEPKASWPEIDVYRAPQATWLSFAWEGAEVPPDEDIMARIDPAKLQAVGEMLSHVLTQIVRQTSF
jgi:hypothetical protein